MGRDIYFWLNWYDSGMMGARGLWGGFVIFKWGEVRGIWVVMDGVAVFIFIFVAFMGFWAL